MPLARSPLGVMAAAICTVASGAPSAQISSRRPPSCVRHAQRVSSVRDGHRSPLHGIAPKRQPDGSQDGQRSEEDWQGARGGGVCSVKRRKRGGHIAGVCASRSRGTSRVLCYRHTVRVAPSSVCDCIPSMRSVQWTARESRYTTHCCHCTLACSKRTVHTHTHRLNGTQCDASRERHT